MQLQCVRLSKECEISFFSLIYEYGEHPAWEKGREFRERSLFCSGLVMAAAAAAGVEFLRPGIVCGSGPSHPKPSVLFAPQNPIHVSLKRPPIHLFHFFFFVFIQVLYASFISPFTNPITFHSLILHSPSPHHSLLPRYTFQSLPP